ncbi:hybrid sensor histidine kinase/response regulator [Geobacter sp. SVR]|nr:hybrid sensor histidine kinase/response regulator [Geobacter sp. SVR]
MASAGPGASAVNAAVLVVDDEKIIRDFCTRALGEYRVAQAGNCHEALKAYEKERHDLVLADVMMPGEDGIDLLRRIKEIDPTAAVIIMTGFTHKEVLLKALREGADDFISKPLNLLQLRTAVAKALGRKYLKEELANLKQLDRLKSHFLSLISHKLRTPITAISLFLQNIQRSARENSDEWLCRNVTLAHEETVYLDRMVNDLLIFSQVMEGGRGLDLEACDLNLLISEVLQCSREAQGKPGVETEFNESPLPDMQLDRTKIVFALQQIVENAYKFSYDTGRVVISAAENDGSITITVSDSGIGIPREASEKVFEKFYQVDPDCTGQVRGFGLGLFYAREFVRQHDGTLTIASEPGRGTTVTMMLPAR